MFWDLVAAPNSTATESDVNISWCREIELLCVEALETEPCAGNSEWEKEICGAEWCFNYSNWNDNNVPLSEWGKLIGWEKSQSLSAERVSFFWAYSGFSHLSGFNLCINTLPTELYFNGCHRNVLSVRCVLMTAYSKFVYRYEIVQAMRPEYCHLQTWCWFSFAFDQFLPLIYINDWIANDVITLKLMRRHVVMPKRSNKLIDDKTVNKQSPSHNTFLQRKYHKDLNG